MMKIDWKRKLSSRKFWALIAALAVSSIAGFGLGDGVAETVSGIIGAVGACACYMLAEAKADAGNKGE